MLDYLIERKAINDLVCSKKDSRYKDQILRIKKSDISNVIYLIEGKYESIIESNLIIKSAVEARSFYKFNVINTHSIEKSIEFISKLHIKICKKIDNEFSNNGFFEPKSEFKEFCEKQNKLKNITIKQVFIEALKRTKIMSITCIFNLTNIFPTFNSLYLAINHKNDEEIDSIFSRILTKDQKLKLLKIFKNDN